MLVIRHPLERYQSFQSTDWHYFFSSILIYQPMPSNEMMQTYFPYGSYTQPQPGFFEIQSYLLWVKSINTSLIAQYESRIQKLKTTLLDSTLKGKDRRKYRQRKLRAAKARTECVNTVSRVDNELGQLNAQVYRPAPPVCPITVPQYIPTTPIYSPALQYPQYQPYQQYQPLLSPIPATPTDYRPSRTQSSPGPTSPKWDAPRVGSTWLQPQQQNIPEPISQPAYADIYQDMPLSPLTPLSYDSTPLVEPTGPPVVGWNPYFSFHGGDVVNNTEAVVGNGVEDVNARLNQKHE